jgi:hypothetical protein
VPVTSNRQKASSDTIRVIFYIKIYDRCDNLILNIFQLYIILPPVFIINNIKKRKLHRLACGAVS